MVNIIIGEKVINKTRETGTIVYCDNNCLQVDFGNRVSKFLLNAFKQGFLKYENKKEQKQVFEAIEEKAKVEQQRIIDEKEKIRHP